MPTARTPQEVFQHHAEALIAGDIDGIVADYSEDAIFITPAGVKRGKEGIRQAFTQLLRELPNAAWDVKTTIFETTSCSSSGRLTPPRTGSRTASTRLCSATA